MSNCDRAETEPLESKLQSISDSIRALATNQQGSCLALLALLRALEGLHQEIRDGLFQESLPDNRQALYSLLKDIEASGGWPYIHRMKLHLLLGNFPGGSEEEAASSSASLAPLATIPTATIEETFD